MKRGTEPFWRPPKRQEVANMEDVLAQLQRSGSIYFVKTLSKTAIQTRKDQKKATLVASPTGTLKGAPSLPTHFAQENGDKIDEWVILRTHKSWGSSSRPWVVRLSATGRSPETREDRICGGGLYAFVVGNQLGEGDSLIFVLREDAWSEFEVYVFRGSRSFPHYPDEGDSASSDEENNDNHSSFPSPLHHQDEHKKAFTGDVGEGRARPSQFANRFENHRLHKKAFTSDVGDGRATPSQFANRFENHRVHKKAFTSDVGEGRATPSQFANRFENHHVHKKSFTSNVGEEKARPSQFTNRFENHRVYKTTFTSDVGEGGATLLQNANHWQNHRVFPSFRKQLTATNIGRSDRVRGSNTGQFGFPTRFIKTHGNQLKTSVKLQGIHEDSPTYVIPCRRRPGYSLRVDFLVTGWSRFVKENGLEKGHELQFSLMADSYFVVRKVNYR